MRFALALCCVTALAGDARILVGVFSAGDLSGWTEKSFRGHTTYHIVQQSARGVLEANSQAAASGLVKKIRIDLAHTPYLHWSWRVDETLGPIAETTKAGDDYPARVYVIVSGGLMFWKTRAVNYVWSSAQTQGAEWPNAFTQNARMIAVRGTETPRGQWLSERRNVREDLRRQFGAEFDHIDAVALMTDTDNTGKSAQAWYGDIYFAAE